MTPEPDDFGDIKASAADDLQKKFLEQVSNPNFAAMLEKQVTRPLKDQFQSHILCLIVRTLAEASPAFGTIVRGSTQKWQESIAAQATKTGRELALDSPLAQNLPDDMKGKLASGYAQAYTAASTLLVDAFLKLALPPVKEKVVQPASSPGGVVDVGNAEASVGHRQESD